MRIEIKNKWLFDHLQYVIIMFVANSKKVC